MVSEYQMRRDYQSNVDNYVNSFKLDDDKLRNVENILLGRGNVARYGRGSKTFMFEDVNGNIINKNVSTYAGRVEAVVDYLGLNMSQLSDLYTVFSDFCLNEDVRSETLENRFADYVRGGNVEGDIGDNCKEAFYNKFKGVYDESRGLNPVQELGVDIDTNAEVDSLGSDINTSGLESLLGSVGKNLQGIAAGFVFKF